VGSGLVRRGVGGPVVLDLSFAAAMGRRDGVGPVDEASGDRVGGPILRPPATHLRVRRILAAPFRAGGAIRLADGAVPHRPPVLSALQSGSDRRPHARRRHVPVCRTYSSVLCRAAASCRCGMGLLGGDRGAGLDQPPHCSAVGAGDRVRPSGESRYASILHPALLVCGRSDLPEESITSGALCLLEIPRFPASAVVARHAGYGHGALVLDQHQSRVATRARSIFGRRRSPLWQPRFLAA
jgi:hypothetical protein